MLSFNKRPPEVSVGSPFCPLLEGQALSKKPERPVHLEMRPLEVPLTDVGTSAGSTGVSSALMMVYTNLQHFLSHKCQLAFQSPLMLAGRHRGSELTLSGIGFERLSAASDE